jgi:hypothetical protein
MMVLVALLLLLLCRTLLTWSVAARLLSCGTRS